MWDGEGWGWCSGGRDHDVGALLMLTKQKWNQMDGDGRCYCDGAELRQLSRSPGGHNGDPCPAWHHHTSRVGFLNFYIDTFAFRILVLSLWKATTSTNAWLEDS